MDMPCACIGTGDPEMERAALQAHSEIAGNNPNQNFDQCDRDSGPNRDQTGDER